MMGFSEAQRLANPLPGEEAIYPMGIIATDSQALSPGSLETVSELSREQASGGRAEELGSEALCNGIP